MREGIIRKLQQRFARDQDALKRVLESFGIIGQTRANISKRGFRTIFTLFPETPVKMLKDVFEALQLYDLSELLDIESMKTHGSLQLAYTLDEIKQLNGVADRPTTYHSCGAVLIITDDDKVSNASEIKTFFTSLDNKSDVFEVITDVTTWRHLEKEFEELKMKTFARVRYFGLLAEDEQVLFLRWLTDASHKLQLRIRQEVSRDQPIIVGLRHLKDDIDIVRLRLNNKFENWFEGKTEMKQPDEFKSFLQSMMVTVDRIQENLTQLIQEKEKEEQNSQENVSAVTNRWIHRQGKYE